MGATTFCNIGKGKTAQDAFSNLVSYARHENGHGGYTGTIAEKSTFNFSKKKALTLEEARRIAKDDVDEFGDKWGPAGCIRVGDTDTYVFFGWASE